MTINVDWGTRNINVPRAEIPLVQSIPVEIRQLDLTEFRYALHDAQDGVYGISYPDTHLHNASVTVAGTVLSQVVEIINGYSITFEDGLYNVNVVGGNSNVSDVTIKNQVGVNTSNSAGLQTYTISNPTPSEIADEVETRTLDSNIVAVTDTPVVDVDDFKAEEVNVDLSGIPQAVWDYATRTITTTVFDTNIIKVNGVEVASINEFKADVSNLSADVNIVEVNGVVVNSIDDFKAAEFDGNVNVVGVAGSVVTSVDDFKADVSGIDLSGIPEAVWTYVARTMTNEIGMTSEQETKLNSILYVLNSGIVDANVVSFETDDVVANPVWNKVIP